ncbi:COP1-interacting protein 7 [Sarracenia purpurea var. burkii]
MELCKKKNDDRLWMDELAVMQAYCHSEFPYVGNSGIILAGEDNDHSQGNMINGSIDASTSDSTVSHGNLDVNPDNSLSKSASVQSTDGKTEVPMSWPNHVPQYMHNFPGPLFPQLPPYQGYLFPGIQGPSYYPGNSGINVYQDSFDRRNRKTSSRNKEKPSHVKGSQTLEQDDSMEPSNYSSSESDSDEFHLQGAKKNSSTEHIHRKKHGKRSSRKVVIRNINYITSKGGGEKEGGASEGNNLSDEHEFISAESLKQQVEEAVGSLERHHKSTTHNKKKSGTRHRGTVNGSNSTVDQDNGNALPNFSEGEKRSENWDIFQNLLMKETDSRSNGMDTHKVHAQEKYITIKMDSEEVMKPLASTDSFIVADRNRSNDNGKMDVEKFEAGVNVQPITKTRGSMYEELLYSQRTEESEIHSRVVLSDCVTESSIVNIQKGGDLFLPGDQPEKSATLDEGTHCNIFDGDYTASFICNHSQLEKNKKDVLVDDSFMIQARPMDNDPFDSQRKTDIYMVSDIAGATQQKISLPDNSPEKVETAGICEPDDLCMVLGRNSGVDQVVTSWNPEMDYGNINSLTESVERIAQAEPADCVDAQLAFNNKGTIGKVHEDKASKARSKTPVGSLGKSKSDIMSMTKKSFSGRTTIQKSKPDKEEEKRKKMEELLIQRQKRIAERSSARGSYSTTSKRTSKECKTLIVSSKNEKPKKLQSPEQDKEKLQKQILRNSTIERLAAAKVTRKSSSTEVKSSQPRKAISKASKTENKKPGTERGKPSDKREIPNNSNGLLSSVSGTQLKKDNNAEATIALPVESSTGKETQPSEGIFVSENVKELQSISTIEQGDKVLKEDKILQIDTLYDQSCIMNCDNEVTSKASRVLEDTTAYVGRVQFVSEVTVIPSPPSPNTPLGGCTSHIDEEGAVNDRFSPSFEISVVKMSTPPQDDGMAPDPIHSRKKWNPGENSPKATKGFRKLLLFGRKSRNLPTN